MMKIKIELPAQPYGVPQVGHWFRSPWGPQENIVHTCTHSHPTARRPRHRHTAVQRGLSVDDGAVPAGNLEDSDGETSYVQEGNVETAHINTTTGTGSVQDSKTNDTHHGLKLHALIMRRI